ncbi:MAG: hypothetical protein NT062_36045 [Proteobacteria bacterium]|nr:hypothetical protein [Pseudomonadota bacterium]
MTDPRFDLLLEANRAHELHVKILAHAGVLLELAKLGAHVTLADAAAVLALSKISEALSHAATRRARAALHAYLDARGDLVDVPHEALPWWLDDVWPTESHAHAHGTAVGDLNLN